MAAQRAHDASVASSGADRGTAIYTHPLDQRPERHVHFASAVEVAGLPEWLVYDSPQPSSIPLSPAPDQQLHVVVVPRQATPRHAPFPLQHLVGPAAESAPSPQPPVTQHLPSAVKWAGTPIAAAVAVPRTRAPQVPQPPAHQQVQPRTTPSPPQTHRHSATPSPPYSRHESPSSRPPATADRRVENYTQPQPRLNTLLQPSAGLSFNFVHDLSTSTIVVSDQTASPTPHFSPPWANATMDRHPSPALSSTLLKPYQREQPASNPPAPRVRVLLPPAIASHHVNRLATSAANSSIGGLGAAGPMVVVINGRMPGSPVTVGQVLDLLRAVLLTPVLQDEWDAAHPADQTTATHAFYARLSHAPDPQREKAFGMRRLDWCGTHSWFGGLEAVSVGDVDSVAMDPHEVTWRLIMLSESPTPPSSQFQ